MLNEQGAVDIHTEPARQALDFYRRLMTDADALHPGSTEFESVRAGAAFAAGEAAMTINWFGFAAACEQESSLVKGRVAVAPVPGDAGGGVTLNVYWLYAIGAGSRKKNAAFDFIRFAVNRQNDKLLTLQGGIGCRYSTWKDPEVNLLIPYYHRLEELHRGARTLPAMAAWPQIARIIDASVQEAIAGDTPAADILKAGQSKIDQLIL